MQSLFPFLEYQINLDFHFLLDFRMDLLFAGKIPFLSGIPPLPSCSGYTLRSFEKM